MKVFIIRHGETEENKKKIIQGKIPGVLTTLGKQQAKNQADRLRDRNIQHIFSSDLARAKDTAQIISDILNIPLTITPLLQERNLGVLEGQSSNQFPQGLQKLCDHTFIVTNGETLEELISRAKKAISFIKDSSNFDTVLLVGHAGFNTGLVAALKHISVKEFDSIQIMKHEDILEFDI